MRPAHTRHRKDGNHVEILDALMAVGATVHESDWVDLIAGYRGRTYLIEVKTARGGLRPSQRTLRDTWRGQYAIVRTADEALKAIGASVR